MTHRIPRIPDAPDELESDEEEDAEEPTQVTKLLQELHAEGEHARQSMTNAVRRAERTRKRGPSERNLRAVVDGTAPVVAAEG